MSENDRTLEAKELIEQVLLLKSRTEKIFIYGAGIYANNVYKILDKNNIAVDAYIVSKIDTDYHFDIPVIEAEKIIGANNVGIVLGLNHNNSNEVKSWLKNVGFPPNNIIDGGACIEHGGRKLGIGGDAMMEITVRIGCPIHCRYCPQDNLIRQYYKNDANRAKDMSLETFKTCLAKIPKEVGIVFAGFAEPFLSDDCIEMLELACADNRKVDLFTTLVGAGIEEVKVISRMPLNYVGLHLADRYGYAHIPVDNEYYKKVEYLLSCKKVQDGSPFVDFCNAQAEPDEKIIAIADGKYTIGTTMQDRAGNLNDNGLVRKRNLKGRIVCSMCGVLTNRNVLLPDGTVVLCCMDYGMKHPLGNLLESSYDMILYGDESKMIRQGLNGDENISLLCRNCSCAREI